MCRAPPWPSSPGWNMKITFPGSSACRADSSRAAPTSIAVCRSWPQACIAPSIADAYGRPVRSVTGSASMSPRSSTVGPGPRAAQHGGHRAELPAQADLQRQAVQRGQHLRLRPRQVKPDLRVPVDGVPQLSQVTGDRGRVLT